MDDGKRIQTQPIPINPNPPDTSPQLRAFRNIFPGPTRGNAVAESEPETRIAVVLSSQRDAVLQLASFELRAIAGHHVVAIPLAKTLTGCCRRC